MERDSEFIRSVKDFKCPKTGLIVYVSNLGETYSSDKRKKNSYSDADGYLYITCKLKGLRQNHKVHRLVGKLFIDNPLDKPEINHKDGNKKNNHIDNLEWNTKSENMKHAVKLKLVTNCTQKGIKHNTAKFTFEDVTRMRKDYSNKVGSMRLLANIYGCSVGYFSDIVNNKIRITE